MIKAVILAGGLGTRLRPATEDIAKPMIKIKGMPFLHFVISDFCKYGIRDFVLACSYHWTQIRNFFQTGLNYKARIAYSIENRPLGSANALRMAFNKIGTMAPFVVANGDTIVQNLDFEKLLLAFGKSGKDICCVRAPNPLKNGQYEFSGISILSTRVLQDIMNSTDNSLEKDYFPKFKIFDYEHNGFYFDIGTKEGFAITEKYLSGEKIEAIRSDGKKDKINTNNANTL